jgi:hypothetical protein
VLVVFLLLCCVRNPKATTTTHGMRLPGAAKASSRVVPFSILALLCVLVACMLLSSRRGLRVRANGPQPTSLIVVPGHAIFTGTDPQNHSDWVTDSWQIAHIPYYLQHIRVGLQLYESRYGSSEQAIVVFSGGQTRAKAGRTSEAASYKAAAQAMGLLTPAMRGAVLTEAFARDSFENLLFSICTFKAHTGRYPARVDVVGYAFKEKRYVSQHAAAIRYRPVTYVGLDKELSPEHAALEEASTIPQFAKDPYGCRPPLSTKRASRNPFGQAHPYAAQCPELADLLAYCGPDLYPRPLPWT